MGIPYVILWVKFSASGGVFTSRELKEIIFMPNLKQRIKRIYRIIMPRSLRNIINQYRDRRKDYFFNLKKRVVKFLKKDLRKNPDLEKLEILKYLKKNPFYMVPYNFEKDYNQDNIAVHFDNVYNMSFVLYDEKRLYFPSGWNPAKIKKYFNSILIEQDIKSPHRYEFYDFCVQKNDVVADIGAAEGFFTLSVIEKCKKAYLFEADEKWIDALRITFTPWKEKVSIVNKYVSDNNGINAVKMDDFFNNENVNFIKVDIEGSESQFLAGASKILSMYRPLRIVICVYHKESDVDDFKKVLTEDNFNINLSSGYLLPWMQLEPPYLRRGVIRATKRLRSILTNISENIL
jgi:hypothetical protein